MVSTDTSKLTFKTTAQAQRFQPSSHFYDGAEGWRGRRGTKARRIHEPPTPENYFKKDSACQQSYMSTSVLEVSLCRRVLV